MSERFTAKVHQANYTALLCMGSLCRFHVMCYFLLGTNPQSLTRNFHYPRFFLGKRRLLLQLFIPFMKVVSTLHKNCRLVARLSLRKILYCLSA